jgi:hypothetical protein
VTDPSEERIRSLYDHRRRINIAGIPPAELDRVHYRQHPDLGKAGRSTNCFPDKPVSVTARG